MRNICILVFLIIIIVKLIKMDTENWMGKLPPVLYNMPINWLAIPGSHDSFSYSISRTSEVAPDESRIKCLACIPLMKAIIFRWSITQSLSCEEQLYRGIRYFDFRVAPKLGSLEAYVVHGLYGDPVTPILRQIRKFLIRHKSEIVLLDFQHFYNFTNEMHKNLISKVEITFGQMICPFGPITPDLRLSHLWKQKHQVLVFYRNEFAIKYVSWAFPSSWMPNPWPNTVKVNEMINTLERNYLKGRKDSSFFVCQGVLTPDASYIFLHLFGNLRQSMAPKTTMKLLRWLRNKTAGRNGINVVMGDDVGSKRVDFIESVIALNYKLAANLSATYYHKKLGKDHHRNSQLG